MRNTYLGIDPGPRQTGWAIWDGEKLLECGVSDNAEVMRHDWLEGCGVDRIGIEMIGHYGTGMAVGKDVFHTCVFIGKLLHKLRRDWYVKELKLILRPSVKTAICGTPRAKDTNVIQALKDQIGDKGTKANQGPLYGIKSHAWQALALAVAMERGNIKEVEL